MVKKCENRTAFPDWFIDELAKNEDKEKAINNTLKLSDRVDFVCPYHGIYNQEIRIHIKKSTGEKIGGCRACGQSSKRHYEQWFIDMLAHEEDKEKARNNTLLSIDKVDFICQKHGIFNTTVGYITCSGKKTGVGCPECGKERQLENYSKTMHKKRPEYPQWFIDDIAKEEDKERARNREITKLDKILFHCKKHGDYLQLVANHLKNVGTDGKFGCRKCAKEFFSEKIKKIRFDKRPEYPEWFIDDLALEEDKERARKRILKTSDDAQFVCPIHGNYFQKVSNHIVFSTQKGRCGCPKCSSKKSKPEDELFELIKSFDKNAIKRDRKTIKNCKTGYYLELDVLCKKRKMAFEFNGDFWHSLKSKTPKYHQLKFDLCQQKGIRLITIFEKDWKENKEKIQNFIIQLLDKHNTTSIKETNIKPVDNKTAKTFFDKYNLFNLDLNNNICFGLYKDNELLSVMSIVKRNSLYEYEITGYCSKFNVKVINGFKKILSFFIRKYKARSITAFTNCEFFTGKTLSDFDFKLVGLSNTPHYWRHNYDYIEQNQCSIEILKSKYPDLYSLAIKENTESIEDFIMQKMNFYKVEKVGIKEWKWENPEHM